jgi:hypothetical protein
MTTERIPAAHKPGTVEWFQAVAQRAGVWPDAHAPCGIWQAVQRYYEAMQSMPSDPWHAVIGPNGDCGVIFRDKEDADFAATGDSAVPHVHTLADSFREIFDDLDDFRTTSLVQQEPR